MRCKACLAIARVLVVMLLTAAAAAAAAPGSRARSTPSAPVEGATRLPAGRFGKVTVYIPDGTSRSVAIFVSGDGGWNLGVVSMAHALTELGAVVIGVDVRQYLSALGKAAHRPDAPCQLIAADFENLSHQIQKEIGMFVYHVPVLVGYSSGATVVYAVLAQSPPGTFAGALSMGFCPDQDFAGAALCSGAGLHYTPGKKNDLIFAPARTLQQPWIAFQGQRDQVCGPAAADTYAREIPGAESGSSDELAILLCIYGEGESDSICPGLRKPPEHAAVTLAEIGKGHHFSGEYSSLAEHILAFAHAARPVT